MHGKPKKADENQSQCDTNPNSNTGSNNGSNRSDMDETPRTGGTTPDTSDSPGVNSSEWGETDVNQTNKGDKQQNIFELLKWLGSKGLLTLEDIQKHIALTQIMRDLPEEKRVQILKIAELLKRQEDKLFKEADDRALKCYQDLIEQLD